MPGNTKDFRLKIEEQFNVRYLTRRNGILNLYSKAGVLLSLSFLTNNTMELRFQLEDAPNGFRAKDVLDDMFSEEWKNNKKHQPKVTIL